MSQCAISSSNEISERESGLIKMGAVSRFQGGPLLKRFLS